MYISASILVSHDFLNGIVNLGVSLFASPLNAHDNLLPFPVHLLAHPPLHKLSVVHEAELGVHVLETVFHAGAHLARLLLALLHLRSEALDLFRNLVMLQAKTAF